MDRNLPAGRPRGRLEAGGGGGGGAGRPGAPRSPAQSEPWTGQALVFHVAERRMAFPLARVREIVRMVSLREVPGALPTLKGLLDLRGEAVAVLHLRTAFGAPPLRDDVNARILLVELDERTYGFEVDEVDEVRAVEDPAPPPAHNEAPYLVGVVPEGERTLLLLDPSVLIETLGGAELPALLAEAELRPCDEEGDDEGDAGAAVEETQDSAPQALAADAADEAASAADAPEDAP